jgi:hypothetical protein
MFVTVFTVLIFNIFRKKVSAYNRKALPFRICSNISDADMEDRGS